nr:MAG TPA: Single stranded DNA binding protein [Caudoviricetes sp.]
MENAIVERNEGVGLQKDDNSFCSMKAVTKEDKARLFNIMNSPSERIADHINETIELKDIFMQTISTTNRITGEVQKSIRIVLIDVNGKGYQAVSNGIYSAVKTLCMIYGQPTWEEPIKIKFTQVNKNDRRILSFVPVE